MLFVESLYAALAVFLIGLVIRVSSWFRNGIGADAGNFSTSDRIFGAFRGLVEVVYDGKLPKLVKTFFREVILQKSLLEEDFLRWLMHVCMYWGFMLLLFMHALDRFITAKIFSNYYSTLNPFMFLRDFFGLMVFVGIGIAVYRRYILKIPRMMTAKRDHYAVIIVAVIMVSGVLLEGAKIVSMTEFDAMVEEYASIEEPEERLALTAWWVENYSVVSPDVRGPFSAETLAAGRELSEMSCVECHSTPESAFLGFAFAKLFTPVAVLLDGIGFSTLLWYIHFLACWIGLAYLPFSKMFHIFATPVSLMANAVMDSETSHPANIATRQVMELDACTHCGTCSRLCSVGTAFESFDNINIFPGEKLGALREMLKSKEPTEEALADLREGICLCTNCRRCTVVCPSGINLQELWFNARERLLASGDAELLTLTPLSFSRGLLKREISESTYDLPITAAREKLIAGNELMNDRSSVIELDADRKKEFDALSLSAARETFSRCFGCETCSTACPVVGHHPNPGEAVGLLPHQIMQACAMGIKELAMGSAMLWDCLTCYGCQEQCPQGVPVTDLLYELKNLAVKDTRDKHSA